MAMQLSALNKIRFTEDEARNASNMEFYGVISNGSRKVEFYFFDDPVMKADGMEMRYIPAEGDLCMFKMAGSSQLMFAGRTKEDEAFRIVAKAKIGEREVAFAQCEACDGAIRIAYKDGESELF